VPGTEGIVEDNSLQLDKKQERAEYTTEVERPKDDGTLIYGPIRPSQIMLLAWAWGNGGADAFDGQEKLDRWEKHQNHDDANFLRRQS
jgi:hypothetical protein